MKRVFIFLSLIIIGSCSKETFDNNNSLHEGIEVSINSSLNNDDYLIIDHSIDNNKALSIVKALFPQKKIKDISSKGNNNDICLYVVNFDDGWAVVSGDDRSDNQILAYGKTGSFNVETIDNPSLLYWYDMTLEYINNLRSIVDKRKVIQEGRSLNQEIDMNEDYYWIRILLSSHIEETDDYVEHLVSTKWGQSSPWNSRTPVAPNGYPCPTGCVAVTVSQILYYLVMEKNFPIDLYHQLTPTFSYYYQDYIPYYYISNYSRSDCHNPSPRWASMPLNNLEANTSYVADLMLDAGYFANMKYSQYGSGASNIGTPFSGFDVNYDSGPYSFSVVKNSLDCGFPVAVSAYKNENYTNGHAWIIDGYRQYEKTRESEYRWYMAPPDSLGYYNYDLCYTEAQKQLYAPEANEEDVFYENIVLDKAQYLRMNWGWDGDGDNGYFHFPDNAWPTGWGQYSFPYYPQIVYNFRMDEN